ncbi:cell division protein ZapA [Granulibacter bethesdensis]|uniref:Cell division protein ZapA n=2 Tax=Granulibacter bethesdensis TaxID=364410 RepID=Q0BT61_GRABC|nr:cell division protein ZapA [Granulibacter bethesdensis]ABI61991.1 putative cytosolic protein [Granulibacter bethesdensis CGDNIH1]AHJ62909.1 putative cytosolic protein [Granulibacter bethesdensis]AHJ69114.1 putative cytosolic protein [Granulibacter bethesdensis]APH51809.1 putative cytosolic protein [Granulibacter bethesdensis]APH64501.1 putative cytosolic protein [Granulibacter bethesdensis]
MAQVTVRINGYAYTVGCEDGQEHHLQAMAQQVEDRIDNIKSQGGQSGEARLLVLASLIMADEIHDLRREVRQLRQDPSRATYGETRHEEGVPAVQDDPAFIERLRRLAERAEEIAASLNHR